MRIYLLFAFLICVFANAFGQNTALKTKAYELGYDHIFKFKDYKIYEAIKNERTGILDENFKILLPFNYTRSTTQGNGLIILKSINDKYSLYDIKNKKFIFKEEFGIDDDYKLNTTQGTKLLFALKKKNDEPLSLYDENGKFISKIREGYGISMHGGQESGVLLLSSQNSFIMIDDKGKEIATYNYMYYPFQNKDIFIVRKDTYLNGKTNMNYGLINHLGKITLPLKYSKIFSEKNYLFVISNSLLSIFNEDMKPLVKTVNGNYGEVIEDNMFLVSDKNNIWRLYDKDGIIIIKKKANKMSYYGKKLFKISKQNETYFINMQGLVVPSEESN